MQQQKTVGQLNRILKSKSSPTNEYIINSEVNAGFDTNQSANLVDTEDVTIDATANYILKDSKLSYLQAKFTPIDMTKPIPPPSD